MLAFTHLKTSSSHWPGSAGKPLSYVGEFLSLRVMKTGLNNTVNMTHIIILYNSTILFAVA